MALANSTDVKNLDLTTAAADAVRNLLEKRELEGYALRVFVQGGGVLAFSMAWL